MKTNISFCICIIITVIITCCDRNTRESIHGIDFSFDNLEKQPIHSFIKEYKIIPLETTNNSLIGDIRKICYSDNKFFILQSAMGAIHKVLIFNEDGDFINAINSQGRGPKEYLHISDFDVHPTKQYISVVDPGNKEMLNYRYDGEFIESRKFSHWLKTICYISCKDNSIRLITDTRSSKSNTGTDYDMIILNEKFEVEQNHFPFKEPVSIGMGNTLFYYKLEDKIGYYRRQTDLVYEIDCYGIYPKYRLNFPKEVLPEESNLDFMKNKISSAEVTYFINYFETSFSVVFSFTVDKKNYLGITGKDSWRDIVISNPDDPSCDCGRLIDIKGVCDNWFVLIANNANVNFILQAIDPEQKKCMNPENFQFIENLNFNSNPVLILFRFEI